MNLKALRQCVEMAEALRDAVDDLDLSGYARDDWRKHNDLTVTWLMKLLAREEQIRLHAIHQSPPHPLIGSGVREVKSE